MTIRHGRHLLPSWCFAIISTIVAVLIYLNWNTPHRALAISISISAMSATLSAATNLRPFKIFATLTLAIMIMIAVTQPSGALGPWVVITTLFSLLSTLRPLRSRQRK